MTLHTPVVAFEATLPAEHARLLRYFNRRVGRDAAPDMVQAVFARMFGSGTLDRIDNPPDYLTRLQRNLLIARARHKHRRSEERRVGKEGVRTVRSRWEPYHS